MVTEKVIKIFLVFFVSDNVLALSFPGPQVYVVTPAAPRPFQVDAKPAPFYYRNWMRRMDTLENTTMSMSMSPTTTTTPRVKTPDLIFAEFETDGSMKKSIRKLLENERIQPKITTTTVQPIYVPESEFSKPAKEEYGLPMPLEREGDKIETQKKDNDYLSMYNNLYNKVPAPAYLPSTTQRLTTVSSTTPSTTTTPINIENIWHIIDKEKLNEENGKWDEVPLPSYEYTRDDNNDNNSGAHITELTDPVKKTDEDEELIDENFALPGFTTNTGSGAENESRAIRTEQNIRFPYVNLKPFQMKNLKKPMLDLLSNSKKGNNLLTSLDNFFDTKNPVRGEAQNFGNNAMNQPIDRYNPAQPYLPQAYSSKSKQSGAISSPSKATASLVPPPPPPSNDANFPSPVSYDAFPPYAPGTNFEAPSPSFPPAPASSLAPEPLPSPPVLAPSDDDSSDTFSGPSGDSDGPSMNIGYRYKAPSQPSPPTFLPTIAPISKPFNGYSYDKPDMTNNVNSMMPMDQSQDFQGYHYSKPKPTLQAPPSETYDSPPSYGNPDSGSTFGSVQGYGDSGPPPEHDSYHYPDSNGNDFKDAGMMPPPDIKPYASPPSDHGFPSDFPTDFKFPHHFDDHDFYHDHPPSTTEMPRVNRFSYYYLGKKLYYLPLYFSVYFIVYVGALIIKAVLRHKIVYPNSWRPNTTTATFFSKRSVDDFLSHDNMHELTGRITHAIATAAEKYTKSEKK